MVETFSRTLKAKLVWRTVFDTRLKTNQAIACHLGGLYTRQATFRPRFHKPGPVRETGHLPNQCLPAKAKQAQYDAATFRERYAGADALAKGDESVAGNRNVWTAR
ncbi:hypothetical protein [Limobrevibacterium gyesilva]|uniref:Uncharacterized protein n=1 Tax=Limobrevibacterium gyesilva TaxID=2991712 RepID=A0AA42CDH6_9PROT|nr:hypothetical protein [Limobrevibacterium gyesilva]MCW3474873.1 hypothetical protein [Limobrevibacterium gyesilva]